MAGPRPPNQEESVDKRGRSRQKLSSSSIRPTRWIGLSMKTALYAFPHEPLSLRRLHRSFVQGWTFNTAITATRRNPNICPLPPPFQSFNSRTKHPKSRRAFRRKFAHTPSGYRQFAGDEVQHRLNNRSATPPSATAPRSAAARRCPCRSWPAARSPRRPVRADGRDWSHFRSRGSGRRAARGGR